MPNESNIRSALPINNHSRIPADKSEFHRAGREVLLDHQSNFEDNCVVKFTEIQTGKLLDFLQTVHKRIAVNKQLAGCFRDIQVVLKETLNGKQCFVIEALDASALEHFMQESLAEGCRQVINQAGNAEIIIADNNLVRIEYLADF